MNNRGEENEMSISVQNITKSFKDRQQCKGKKTDSEGYFL